MRNLSDAEKNDIFRIAIETPEAKGLKDLSTLKTDLGWVAVVRYSKSVTVFLEFDYDVWKTGLPTSVPMEAIIFPQISFYSPYNPQAVYLKVAVDMPAGQAAFARITPAHLL